MLRRDVRIGLALSGRLLRAHLRDDLLCDLPSRQIFPAPLQPHGQLGRRSFKFLPCPAAYGKVGGTRGKELCGQGLGRRQAALLSPRRGELRGREFGE
jgi:hypothetical protein